MKFSCGISSRSDFVKKFIEQFPPTKAQSTKIDCAFSLPAPYTAGFMQKLILAGDDEGIILPKNVSTGHIIKNVDENGNKRYDFQFENKRGYKVTIEGLSEKFNKEYWNYAKLISGVLRYRMPIEQVMKLVSSLQLDSENINTWKNGVERALKKYVTDGTAAKGQKCPNCGNETLVYQEGCLICTTCGTSRCG